MTKRNLLMLLTKGRRCVGTVTFVGVLTNRYFWGRKIITTPLFPEEVEFIKVTHEDFIAGLDKRSRYDNCYMNVSAKSVLKDPRIQVVEVPEKIKKAVNEYYDESYQLLHRKRS